MKVVFRVDNDEGLLPGYPSLTNMIIGDAISYIVLTLCHILGKSGREYDDDISIQKFIKNGIDRVLEMKSEINNSDCLLLTFEEAKNAIEQILTEENETIIEMVRLRKKALAHYTKNNFEIEPEKYLVLEERLEQAYMIMYQGLYDWKFESILLEDEESRKLAKIICNINNL
jgi:hypothetical protein